jgi:hypothetical protein
MANLTERILDIEKRLLYVEKYLGITLPEGWHHAEFQKPAEEVKPEKQEPEETVSGFTKSQLRIMFAWAKNFKLQQLSRGDFEELKKWQMLKEFFPNSPDNFDDIIL